MTFKPQLHLKLEVLGHILQPLWALLVHMKRIFAPDKAAIA